MDDFEVVDERIEALKKNTIQSEIKRNQELNLIRTNNNDSNLNLFFDLQNKEFVFNDENNDFVNDNFVNNNDLVIENTTTEINNFDNNNKIFHWNDVQQFDKKRKALENLEKFSEELETEFSKKDTKIVYDKNHDKNNIKKPSKLQNVTSKKQINSYKISNTVILILLTLSLLYVIYVTVGLGTSYLKLNS